MNKEIKEYLRVRTILIVLNMLEEQEVIQVRLEHLIFRNLPSINGRRDSKMRGKKD
jgi:hypothetical protein